MANGELSVVPLHDNKYHHLTGKCAEMLNKEWRRSFGMRERWLQQSTDSFPYHVFLIKLRSDPIDLIGHAKISKVLGKPKALYVSSVIIRDDLRGNGFGKSLMKLIEEHMLPKGYDTLYLRTDTPDFYVKCGYQTCDPVQELKNPKMEEQISLLNDMFKPKPGKESCKNFEDEVLEKSSICDVINNNSPSVIIPPAPCAPDPPCKTTCKRSLFNCIDDDECGEFQCKSWMKKDFFDSNMSVDH